MKKRIIYTCPRCYKEFVSDIEYDSDEGVEYIECPHCHAKPTVTVHPQFEFGDRAKITANENCHKFEIGEEITITEMHNDCGTEIYYKATNGTSEWYVMEADIRAIEAKPITAVDKFSREIVEALRQRIGLEADDNSRDGEFLYLSPAEALDGWLTWNGICGYTDAIISAVEDTFKTKLVR